MELISRTSAALRRAIVSLRRRCGTDRIAACPPLLVKTQLNSIPNRPAQRSSGNQNRCTYFLSVEIYSKPQKGGKHTGDLSKGHNVTSFDPKTVFGGDSGFLTEGYCGEGKQSYLLLTDHNQMWRWLMWMGCRR